MGVLFGEPSGGKPSKVDPEGGVNPSKGMVSLLSLSDIDGNGSHKREGLFELAVSAVLSSRGTQLISAIHPSAASANACSIESGIELRSNTASNPVFDGVGTSGNSGRLYLLLGHSAVVVGSRTSSPYHFW